MPTRILRKFIFWFSGLLFASLVLASIAISVIDWNQYRESLSSLVSGQIGMRVDIGGRISAGLFPRPNVVTEGVRLYPETDFGAPEVATASRIEIRLGLVALLKGQLAIQHLGFDGLDVTLNQTEDGGWQVKGWPRDSASSSSDSSSRIVLDKLKVIGSTIRLLEEDGTERQLEGLSLDLSGSLPDGPLEWSGSFSLAGESVSVDGRMRPGMEGKAYSVKTDLLLGGGTMVVSGRLEPDGFSGRVRAQGPSLSKFAAAVVTLARNEAGALAVPPQPFDLDIQIERDGSLHRLTTRALQVGDSRGRLDITVAARDTGFHTAGTASFGVIDSAPWLAAIEADASGQGTSGLSEDTHVVPPAKEMPLSGTLDVTVEGVSVAGGTIQQIDAILAFGADGFALTNLQALLPGGTGLIVDGRLAATEADANIQMTAANLPELLRWVGVDVSSRIPAGRLATGELSAHLTLDGTFWRLDEIDARVDTSNFTGEVFGSANTVWPTRMKVEADTVNLDAYLTSGSGNTTVSQPFSGLPETVLDLELSADRIQWGGNLYKAFVAEAKINNQQASIARLQVQEGRGLLAGTATISPHASGLALESEIRLTDWSFPGVRSQLDEASPYFRALKLGETEGLVSLSGPLETLLVSATVQNGLSRQVTVSGTVSAPDFTFVSANLQGRFKHDDLAPALRLQGLKVAGLVPVDFTYRISQKATEETAFSVSGDLAGGQLQTNGVLNELGETIDITFDHGRAGDALANAGLAKIVPNPDRSMRVSTKLTAAQGSWSLDDLDLRNGDARLSGTLASDQGKRISGNITAAGLTFTPEHMAAQQTAEDGGSAKAIDTAVFDYTGDVAINLEDFIVAGQRLLAPAARLSAGDGTIRFNLGAGALVNGQPSELTFDLADSAKPLLSGKAVIPALNIGDLLLSGGLKQAVTGTASLSAEFEGSADTAQGTLQSLKGRLTLDGQAGVLNFLSVPELVRSMNQASSSSGFLAGIGNLLRAGATNFSDFEASISIDGGTALVERVEVAGAWGKLGLDGQVNLIDRLLSLQGQLDLTNPKDAPSIPVRYSGSLDNPSSEWTSRALERFVIAGIERRLRATLLKDLDTSKKAGAASNPGAAVFSRALGLLGALRQQQQKKAEEEAAKATADQPPADPSSR